MLPGAEGLKGPLACLDSARYGIAWGAVGAAQACFDEALRYSKTRVQFDRPIASFQALKHRVAGMKVESELARVSAAQALVAAESNAPDRMVWAALAKATVSDSYAAIAGHCVQLHGGVGFTWALDVHLYQKRSRLNQALLATGNEAIDFAAAELAAATRDGRSALDLPLELAS